MTGGEADISRSGILNCFNPSVGVKACRIESGGSFAVLIGRDSDVEIPFSLFEHAVDTPVDKYAESMISEFFTCADYFGRRFICGCRWCTALGAYQIGERGQSKGHGCDAFVHDAEVWE